MVERDTKSGKYWLYLSLISLIFAIIAFIYGMWYADERMLFIGLYAIGAAIISAVMYNNEHLKLLLKKE